MGECSVCWEELDLIECPLCSHKSCPECTRRYILEGITKAKCMECKITWDEDFLLTWNTKQWVSGKHGPYRKFCAKILSDREMSKMEETIPKYDMYLKEIRIKEINKEMLKLKKEKDKLKEEIKDYTRIEYNFLCGIDDCLGRVNSDGDCVICKTHFCLKCRKNIESEGHECNKNDVESIKLLNDETHPCPKCSVPIFKLDGCDQMWCSRCHINFSWKTGLINYSGHNPDRVRFEGTMERDPLDIPCGGFIPPEILERELKDLKCPNHKAFSILSLLVPYCSEGYDNCIYVNILLDINEKIQTMKIETIDESMEDIRLRLLNKEITKEEFRNMVYLRDRQNSRDKIILNSKILLRNLSVEIIRNLYLNPRMKNLKDSIENLLEVKEMVNDYLGSELPKHHAKKIKRFNADWVFK